MEEKSLSTELRSMAAQFKAALPPHVPVERFVRVVLTAVNGSPELAQADRRSLFEAAMKAAQDGLLPDGRDAAFVVFNTRGGAGKEAIRKVQYMPMIWGIVKKVRNSGELLSIAANVVYSGDVFDYTLGDNEKIEHKPALTNRGKPVCAYAIAKTKDGAVYREVMTEAEIDAVRGVSRAGDAGPWGGPFRLEMWRKTVLRRLAKRLPMSTDLETIVERDDDMYDFSQRAEPVQYDEPRAVGEQKPVEADAKKETGKAQAAKATGAGIDKRAAALAWIEQANEVTLTAAELSKRVKGLNEADTLECCKAFNARKSAGGENDQQGK